MGLTPPNWHLPPEHDYSYYRQLKQLSWSIRNATGLKQYYSILFERTLIEALNRGAAEEISLTDV